MKTGESDIQTQIVQYLAMRHDVAWVYVTSSGKMRGAGGRYYTIGFPGLTDILGQLRDGRILAVEIKQPKKRPDEHQYEFMTTVALNNGIAFWCDSVESCKYHLDMALCHTK